MVSYRLHIDRYQPNDTEEMYLKEQNNFEIDEENDVDIITAKRSINIPATTLALFEYTKVLRKLDEELDKFISEEGSVKKTLKELIYLQSQGKSFEELLYYSIKSKDDCMFYLPKSSTTWQQLDDFYQLVSLGTEEEIDNAYSNLTQGIIFGNAIASK